MQTLTYQWQRSLSFRNQSIDLLCKSGDWFLYDRDLHHEKVKTIVWLKVISFSYFWYYIHFIELKNMVKRHTFVVTEWDTFLRRSFHNLHFHFLLENLFDCYSHFPFFYCQTTQCTCYPVSCKSENLPAFSSLHIHIIYRRYHIITPLTFWICTPRIYKMFVYKHTETIEYIKN